MTADDQQFSLRLVGALAEVRALDPITAASWAAAIASPSPAETFAAIQEGLTGFAAAAPHGDEAGGIKKNDNNQIKQACLDLLLIWRLAFGSALGRRRPDSLLRHQRLNAEAVAVPEV